MIQNIVLFAEDNAAAGALAKVLAALGFNVQRHPNMLYNQGDLDSLWCSWPLAKAAPDRYNSIFLMEESEISSQRQLILYKGIKWHQKQFDNFAGVLYDASLGAWINTSAMSSFSLNELIIAITRDDPDSISDSEDWAVMALSQIFHRVKNLLIGRPNGMQIIFLIDILNSFLKSFGIDWLTCLSSTTHKCINSKRLKKSDVACCWSLADSYSRNLCDFYINDPGPDLIETKIDNLRSTFQAKLSECLNQIN